MNNIDMKKIFIIFLIIFATECFADTIEGRVSEQGEKIQQHRIIDKQTGLGIDNAQIALPKENYYTRTDQDGYFDLDANMPC